MCKTKNKHSGFSGSLGFVLAAAGSAVGVGNIWRFPYLCAKDGGGLFLLVYLVLVLTFGFTLLTTDVAIGRRTKQNALNAFGTLHKKWRFLGYLTFLVPTLIMTYYSVIGVGSPSISRSIWSLTEPRRLRMASLPPSSPLRSPRSSLCCCFWH